MERRLGNREEGGDAPLADFAGARQGEERVPMPSRVVARLVVVAQGLAALELCDRAQAHLVPMAIHVHARAIPLPIHTFEERAHLGRVPATPQKHAE